MPLEKQQTTALYADKEGKQALPSPKKGIPDASSFLGIYDQVQKKQGKLPHWEHIRKIQFVTFRLADSLPDGVVEKLSVQRDCWIKEHPGELSEEEWQEYDHLFSERMDQLLDAGHGSCCLASQEIQQLVADAILFFDSDRYVIYDFVIMPNHAHVLLEMSDQYLLSDILHSWKSFTANKINRITGNKGPVWQKESFDTMLRSAKHFYYVVNYIRKNAETFPQKAFLYSERKRVTM